MSEADPRRDSRENRINRIMATLTAVGVVALGFASLRREFEDYAIEAFYAQYLDSGKCLADSYYVGGSIAIHGVGIPGETTITIRPNEARVARPIDLASASLTFIQENGVFKPLNPMAISTAAAYHCPEVRP